MGFGWFEVGRAIIFLGFEMGNLGKKGRVR